MLLSKALKMQQDLQDKKNKIIIEGLESKIKEYEASLEKKDFLLQAVEGSLAEAQAKNTRLNRELLQKSESFEQENTKLKQSLKELRNMCLSFGSRWVQRLKKVFNSVRSSAEKFTRSAENISSTFEHIEGEVEALDEVIAGHGDFCALLASRGTAAAFLKAGCTHAKIVNWPTFSISSTDLVDIPKQIYNTYLGEGWSGFG
jgi:DNA repair exonuclease SbcCD ATPase subunit